MESGRIITETISGGFCRMPRASTVPVAACRRLPSAPRDHQDIQLAAEIGVDYLAVSYPRSGGDIYYARELLREAGGNAHLIAKIERAEAVENIDEILDASDAIMVARGDLGVEIGDPGTAGGTEELDPQGLAAQPGRNHGDADDGVHDHQHHSDARGGVRCRQCRAGRDRRRDAVGRDGDWKQPGRRRCWR